MEQTPTRTRTVNGPAFKWSAESVSRIEGAYVVQDLTVTQDLRLLAVMLATLDAKPDYDRVHEAFGESISKSAMLQRISKLKR